jgi:hypothetical protein
MRSERRRPPRSEGSGSGPARGRSPEPGSFLGGSRVGPYSGCVRRTADPRCRRPAARDAWGGSPAGAGRNLAGRETRWGPGSPPGDRQGNLGTAAETNRRPCGSTGAGGNELHRAGGRGLHRVGGRALKGLVARVLHGLVAMSYPRPGWTRSHGTAARHRRGWQAGGPQGPWEGHLGLAGAAGGGAVGEVGGEVGEGEAGGVGGHGDQAGGG